MNRLANATSPYLRQHADNPVDWHAWGEEAFAQARERDVPILLSVGYSACHWCHVMAHESFEDDVTAAYMNEHFVNIKVDREERPDVDAVYMEATQAMTGQGGWPMTCFLTPTGEPFYCGTYFPPTPHHGLPSFAQVLEAVERTWRERRQEVVQSAESIVAQLAGSGFPTGGAPGADRLDAAVEVLRHDFDLRNAGFGGAPKFPPSMVLEFLLRAAVRRGEQPAPATGEDAGEDAGEDTADTALAMVEQTCDRMARGGMYDQLAGGFARYSVDAGWVVPHFEKMLYDNALLLRVYVHWWRLTGAPLAERVVRETADFLLRELRTAEGGFASALDADSEGVEGKFYAWTPDQLREVLGPDDGAAAARTFAVTEQGTFEHGASTLQLPRDPEDARWFADVRARLARAREERVRPGRDDKVVAAWNGLAIAALAEAGALLEVPDYVRAATEAADLLVRLHTDAAGRLVRTSRDGVAGDSPGVLEDYADVAEGYLALLAVTGDPVWLTRAGGLLDVVLDRFGTGDGGFFDTADDAERLVRRPQDPTDNAVPSGRSAAAGALLTYAALTGSDRHRSAAESALAVAGRLADRAPRAAGWGLAVAEALIAGPVEVAVVGTPDDPDRERLHRLALRSPEPGLVVVVGAPEAPPRDSTPRNGHNGDGQVPLLAHRGLVDDRAAAYVCRGFVCERPLTDPAELAGRLGVRGTT
ncbi:thioredoxin domain-containing protein [Actinopolymorpha sp. NPDC004070]|uniref:thioredoxin domain-containing protein n=1 Tax=Actinopolymorpha sp. NPDC004070 TaxID=3154548 RepID=UPI0033AF25AD